MPSGAVQLPLFPAIDFARMGPPEEPPRTNAGDVQLEVERPEPRCRMVTVWHARAWRPTRMFTRHDGTTTVVFAISDADGPVYTEAGGREKERVASA
ncbi:MAG TPA: hypothetical protein VMD91_10530 [Candidatus Sulfotelmatobacter sp.]|nr:hypothetical protein [Candidatus Sulfotelmatobacter sp.]